MIILFSYSFRFCILFSTLNIEHFHLKDSVSFLLHTSSNTNSLLATKRNFAAFGENEVVDSFT